MTSHEEQLRTSERFATALQLYAAGVPLDLHQFDARGDLIIRQIDGELENSAFDLGYGTVGCIIIPSRHH